MKHEFTFPHRVIHAVPDRRGARHGVPVIPALPVVMSGVLFTRGGGHARRQSRAVPVTGAGHCGRPGAESRNAGHARCRMWPTARPQTPLR